MSIVDCPSTIEHPPAIAQPAPPSLDDHHEHKVEPLLPPAILLRILHLLPVPSLAHVALASKQLKTLVYQDVIWRQKLRSVLENDTTGLDEAISSSVHPSSTDSSSDVIEEELLETGRARKRFKRLYTLLVPYYTDLRHTHWESNKLLTEYGSQPKACAQWLKRLQAFGVCNPLDDSRQINEALKDACRYFEDASLSEFEIAYDANNIKSMKLFAQALIELNGGATCEQTYFQKNYLLCDHPFVASDNFKASASNLKPLKTFLATVQDEFMEQSRMISQVFPDETMDTYYLFVDRILEDVVSEYLASVFAQAQAQERDRSLYLHTFSVAVGSLSHTLGSALTDSTVLPRTIDHERGINLLYKLFIPFLDDYLAEEEAYVKESSRTLVDEWNYRVADLHRRRREEAAAAAAVDNLSSSGARLTNQTREIFKRNYLLAFKKVITVPVDLVSTAAITIASPFQRSSSSLLSPLRSSASSSSLAVITPAIPSSSTAAAIEDAPSSSSAPLLPLSPDTPPSTPKVKATEVALPSKDIAVVSPAHSLRSRQSSQQSLQSTSDAKNTASELKTAMHELDVMQDFLSLDTVLQLIHLNKDAERRVDQLMSIGFPGRMAGDIHRAYEHIFVQLVKALGGQHIKPAFDRASEHLSTYTPSMDSILVSPSDVAPLTEFFEMVHVGDVIQQMVQLYYDEAISKHIDKQDFMSEINKEKKVFERILDDSVACGMDKSIQVLLAQVEYILAHEQVPGDYNPTENADMDLQPTKACRDALECLRSNTSILQGAAEKTTMDLFFSEVGRRFAEILCKHLKSFTVSEKGGFQYISDINAYHDFIQSLRQKMVTRYFSALKSMANIYIVSSPQDLKEMVHDLERYDNQLSLEDMIEFASCRSDWVSVKKVVMKDMTECSVM